MSKKHETWTCGDCQAVHPQTILRCDAPQHGLGEEVVLLRAQKSQLEAKVKRLSTSWYMTRDTFMKGYTAALEVYLAGSFKGDAAHHPEDLAAAASAFNDAFDAIMDNMDFSSNQD